MMLCVFLIPVCIYPYNCVIVLLLLVFANMCSRENALGKESLLVISYQLVLYALFYPPLLKAQGM